MTEKIKTRVGKARELQEARFKKWGRNIKTNSEMSARDIAHNLNLSEQAKNALNTSASRYDLSGRAYHRVIKLARTIADLYGKENIEEQDIYEALTYRPKKNY